MAVKRVADPAGLRGDRITVSGEILPGTPEAEALEEILQYGTPAARVERLREHGELVARAEQLARRLRAAKGRADLRLLHDIAQAEQHALYLAAATSVIRDRKRQAGVHKERRPDITLWIDEQLRRDPGAKSPALWAQAPEHITDQIGERAFARRVTERRKSRASK